MDKGIYFFAGIYGVGKSTICSKINQVTSIPFYSAGDLISEVNGEVYGANKSVKDKNKNQDILLSVVDLKLNTVPLFMLAGHFCIFDNKQNIEILPEQVFKNLHILKIILLEAPIKQIYENIRERDLKEYNLNRLEKIKETERHQARKMAEQLGTPFLIHDMKFDSTDLDKILLFLTEGGQL